MSERREFIRVPLKIDIQLTGGEHLNVLVNSQDLSLRGVRVEGLAEISVGADCELSIMLGQGDAALRVEVMGRVAHVDEDGVGVEFIGIRGAEAMDHLRRLVLHNAPNAAQAEMEMRLHRGLKRREADDD